MALVNLLNVLAEATNNNLGLGEGWIACHAIDAMSRNPENAGKFQSVMILAIALDESCGIYALIVSMLIMFVLGGRA